MRTAGRLTVETPAARPVCDRGRTAGSARATSRFDRWRALRRLSSAATSALPKAYRVRRLDDAGPEAAARLGRRDNEPALERAMAAAGGEPAVQSPAARAARRTRGAAAGATSPATTISATPSTRAGSIADMTYSSATLWRAARRSLEAAQRQKLDRVVELLDLAGGEQVLEIGCGWGALAERLTATATATSPA